MDNWEIIIELKTNIYRIEKMQKSLESRSITVCVAGGYER
jgi:two-component SAPR family response regulator